MFILVAIVEMRASIKSALLLNSIADSNEDVMGLLRNIAGSYEAMQGKLAVATRSNAEALKNATDTVAELTALLKSLGFTWKSIEPGLQAYCWTHG